MRGRVAGLLTQRLLKSRNGNRTRVLAILPRERSKAAQIGRERRNVFHRCLGAHRCGHRHPQPVRSELRYLVLHAKQALRSEIERRRLELATRARIAERYIYAQRVAGCARVTGENERRAEQAPRVREAFDFLRKHFRNRNHSK